MVRPQARAPLVFLLVALSLTGCAGRRAPATAPSTEVSAKVEAAAPSSPSAAATPATPGATPVAAGPPTGGSPSPASAASDIAPSSVAPPVAIPYPETGSPAVVGISQAPPLDTGAPPTPGRKPSLHDLCHEAHGDEGVLEQSHRRLAETFCTATLWFDGLFGGTADIENARAVGGRVELSGLHTDYAGGVEPKVRLRLNYDLPNLQKRVRLFLGREDQDLPADRTEGFPIRSSVFGLENREEWLAGLGYTPPAPFLKRTDFGVGVRIKSAPEIFAQARYRRNVFYGTSNVWRFRETAFYENRDRFGLTSSLDWDHVLTQDILGRWNNVGTWSQDLGGIEWRSAVIIYRNLYNSHAIAGETFWRGSTEKTVGLREFGVRGVYRFPLTRDYLFGDFILGYSWPREHVYDPRMGSAMIGLGMVMTFGEFPF